MHPLLEQFRLTAQHRVSPEFWTYVMRGTGSNHSVQEAENHWHRYRFEPLVLRDVSTVDTRLELFGSFESPIGVAPTAFHRLAHPRGEVETADGASAVGAPFVLSSRATTRLEDVARAAGGPWWLQVYVTRERAITEAMVRRAAAAGAAALVLTADTPYVGHRDVIGPSRPIALDEQSLLVNMGDHLAAQQRSDPWPAIDQDPSIGVEAIAWLRELSGLPVIVKGVLRADDAQRFVDAGAAGIWVSNHGGRQLDRAVGTACALPNVRAAVGDDTPVLVDGGVRDGFDVLTALALGASAVFVGRPVLWALAADGSTAVASLLRELTDELRHLMGLAGVRDLTEIRQANLIAGR